MQRLAACALAALAASCLVASPARALLEGGTVSTAFYFPDRDTIGFGGVQVDSVVGAGVEIAASPQGFPIAQIDFSDTEILLEFTANGTGTVATFNGWRFFDDGDGLPAFTHAVLETSLPGWSLDFDADNLWLDGAGASFTVGSTARIRLVPEPSVAVLLLLAMAPPVRWCARRWRGASGGR